MILFFAQDQAAQPAVETATAPDSAPAAGGLTMEGMLAWLLEHGLNVAGAIAILLLAWILGGWVRRAVRGGAERAHLDQTLSKFMGNLAKWALLALAILTCMEMLGVKTTSFAALIAAIGFAIGFALNGTLGDLAAGVMLLIFRPFNVGDVVKIAGEGGTVDEIELFFTQIDTIDGRRLVIPNSKVFGSPIENITHHPRRRVDITVRVDYSASIDQTRQTLERAVRGVELGLADPAPAVFLEELGESAVRWSVFVWSMQADFGAVKEATIAAVKNALNDAGIPFAVPRMHVNVNQCAPTGA